jgi:hypothetical protein
MFDWLKKTKCTCHLDWDHDPACICGLSRFRRSKLDNIGHCPKHCLVENKKAPEEENDEKDNGDLLGAAIGLASILDSSPDEPVAGGGGEFGGGGASGDYSEPESSDSSDSSDSSE